MKKNLYKRKIIFNETQLVFSVGKFVSFQFEGHESHVMLNINEMCIEYA